MDNSPMTFTSLALCVLLMAMVIMFICHCLGPRTNSWMRSNKEEKIGLSKNKLFHANGYMIHSGSEFLLSTSGSFKRFDTVDKDDHNYNGPPLQTTPLWNLPQTDCNIPPQPLRPAPAPGTKTVTFSLHKVNEITSPLENNLRRSNTLISCMRSSANKNSSSKILQSIDAPPPPRLSSSSSMLCATAIPRPITKRQISLQNTICLNSENMTRLHHKENSVSCNEEQQQHSRTLKRHNSSTNPFLCESLESFPEKYESTTTLQMHKNYYSNNNNNKSNGNSKDTNVNAVNCVNTKNDNLSTNCSNNPFHDNSNCVFGQLDVIAPLAADVDNASKIQSTTVDDLRPEINSQQQTLFNFKNSVNPLATAKQIFQNPQQFRNRSFSESEATPETTDIKTLSSKLATAGLQKLSNTTNPFTGLSQKVKGPHMLQKTISEDFLFRKLGVNHANYGGTTSGGTWSFGRGLMRQNSASSLSQRNNSQYSLDSIAFGSVDGINLEHAISCDSVNSDSSLFLPDLDQPYTQITGYLCIGLQYDKNSPTEDGMDLTVQVLEAKGLICPLNVESLDTFVRIYLVPDQAGAMQTKVFKNSKTPQYNEAFNFWLKRQYRRHSLWFHLYHNGDAHTLIGEAEMEMTELLRPITTWIPLSDSRKCNAKWGELMISLSYLPTAERLTIVVVKARNVKLKMDGSENGSGAPQEVQNVFVKVYLMNNEKKVLKKRTSIRRTGRNIIFNESVIFSLPPQSLTTVQLRLTVFGIVGSIIVPLGHVIAGSCSTGKGLRHWHQMLSSLRKPVAMWHILRRATNQPIFTGGAEAVVAALQSNVLRAKRNSVV